MSWRRNQGNKRKKSKLRSGKEVYKAVRKPIAPTAKVHKSKKDYDRAEKDWEDEDI